MSVTYQPSSSHQQAISMNLVQARITLRDLISNMNAMPALVYSPSSTKWPAYHFTLSGCPTSNPHAYHVCASKPCRLQSHPTAGAPCVNMNDLCLIRYISEAMSFPLHDSIFHHPTLLLSGLKNAVPVQPRKHVGKCCSAYISW